jgi:hypothetical protein
LPSVTFGIIKNEIFPWALIYSSFFIDLKKVNKLIILFIFFLTFYIIGSVYLFLTPISQIFSTLVSYLNILLTLIVFIKINKSEIQKIINISKISLVIFLIFGIFQYFKLTFFLDEIYSFFIPRGNYMILDDLGRGVSIFSTEPSRASIEIIFLSFLIRKFIKTHKSIFDILIILYVNLIIQGGYALLYSSLYLFFSIKSIRSKFIFIPFVVSTMIYYTNAISNSRGFFILEKLYNSDLFLEVLVNLSGVRVLSFFSTTIYAFNNLFGGGFGNWAVSSIEAARLTPFSPSSINFFINNCEGFWCSYKPSSIYGNILLDFGLFGAMFLCCLLFIYLKSHIYIYKFNFDVYLTFLIYFFLFGYLGNPIPIIVLAICLNKDFNLIIK